MWADVWDRESPQWALATSVDPKCLDVDDLAYDYVLEHNHITLHFGVCLIFQHWYLLQSTHLGRQGDNEQDVLLFKEAMKVF